LLSRDRAANLFQDAAAAFVQEIPKTAGGATSGFFIALPPFSEKVYLMGRKTQQKPCSPRFCRRSFVRKKRKKMYRIILLGYCYHVTCLIKKREGTMT